MKRLTMILTLIIVLSLNSSITFAESSISTEQQKKLKSSVVLYVGSPKAFVNNNETIIDSTNKDVCPLVIDGRTLVPVRFISESLGAKVDWNESKRSINVRLNDKLIQLVLDSKIITSNGVQKEIDVPAQTINERTFIPLRALVETLGKKVFWDDRGLIVISDDENILDQSKDDLIITQIASQLEVRGNSLGNINNYETIAEQGDWIYYSFDDKGLYKSKKDGSQKQKIWNYGAGYINVVGDWVYCNTSMVGDNKKIDSGFYKIKIDGSQYDKLSDMTLENINVVNDWIYYDSEDNKCKPSKMKIDGSSQQTINNLAVRCINVTGSWIYFQNGYDDNKLYKMKTDGSQLKKLSDFHHYKLDISVSGDWIYYLGSESGLFSTLRRIKIDGTNEEELLEDNVFYMNVVDDWIYYSNFNGGIYKIKTDGSNKQKLSDDKVGEINIIDDYLYYCKYRNLSESDNAILGTYKIKTDGTNKTAIIENTEYNKNDDKSISIKEVTVGTIDELVNAIASNTKIILKPGIYNLSKIPVEYTEKEYINISFGYDNELNIGNIKNFSIIGEDYKSTKIIIESGYANVLSFKDSDNITIKGITFGHDVEKGSCTGGVCVFNNCKNINIDSCDLYGCGTEGLTLRDVDGLNFTNSIIRECSEAIMTINDSKNLKFTNSYLKDTVGFSYMINIYGKSDAIFDNVNITNNSSYIDGTNGFPGSELFDIDQDANVILKNSKITNNKLKFFQRTKKSIKLENNTIQENDFANENDSYL